jgi:hypothetical protein
VVRKSAGTTGQNQYPIVRHPLHCDAKRMD